MNENSNKKKDPFEISQLMLSHGFYVAGYFIEGGLRKFEDYARMMIETIGGEVKPYLKLFYEGLRRAPFANIYVADMDSTEFVDKYNLDDLDMLCFQTEKEEFLQNEIAKSLLQNMVLFKKELLLELIRTGTLLKHILELSHISQQMRQEIQIGERSSDIQLELEWQTEGYDPLKEPTKWTKKEARIANQWWEDTFPGENNPLGLYEDELDSDGFDEDAINDEQKDIKAKCNENKNEDSECTDENESLEDNIWCGETVCDICGKTIHGNLYDGARSDDITWATMCQSCFREHGQGVGWGTGQQYREFEDGSFILVAGGESDSGTETSLTQEMKEDFLQSNVALQILQQMVEFEKQTVLSLIQEKVLLENVLRRADRYYEMSESPVVQERLKNLSPDVEMEMRWEIMGYDPSMIPSEWTRSEAHIVNQWWEETFPDEPNPLYLEEDDLPEELEEEEPSPEKIHQQWMDSLTLDDLLHP